MGGKNYAREFVVCKYLKHPCTIGTNLLRKNAIYAGWDKWGKFNLKHDDDFLVKSIDMQMTGPMLYNKCDVKLPTRSIAGIKTKADSTKEEGYTYDIKPNFSLYGSESTNRDHTIDHTIDLLEAIHTFCHNRYGT